MAISASRPPPAPRERLIPEWWAPWLQDPAFLRPDQRKPPFPEFDDEVEEHLFRERMRPPRLISWREQ